MLFKYILVQGCSEVKILFLVKIIISFSKSEMLVSNISFLKLLNVYAEGTLLLLTSGLIFSECAVVLSDFNFLNSC